MTQKPPKQTHLEPLTRRNNEGITYQRDSVVEEQIISSLAMTDDEIIARASIEENTDDGYVQEETLIYLIRRSFQENKKTLYDALSKLLLTRLQDQVDYQLRALRKDLKEDAYWDVVQMLFDAIFDIEGKGDFLQVRFWPALKRMAIDVFRKYYRQQSGDQKNLIPNLFLSSDETGDNDDIWENIDLDKDRNFLEDSKLSSIELENLKNEALQLLEEPIRTAFVLHYYEGWPIESNDPNAITLSKYYKKTPKTIGNWLRKAEIELKKWRGDQHE